MSVSVLADGPSIELSGSGSSIAVSITTGGGGGGVSDHGALTGLDDDDHTQYAKADGTRGTFATTAQGAKADTATQPADLAAAISTHSAATDPHGDRAYTDAAVATAGDAIAAVQLYDYPVDISGAFGQVPPIANLPIIVNGQTDPNDDGLYLSDGAGGVDTGTRVEIKTMANVGRVVSSTITYTDADLTDPDGNYDHTMLPESTLGDLRVVAFQPPATIYLQPVLMAPDAATSLIGRLLPPAPNDYVVDADTTLTFNHSVVIAQALSAPITVTLGVHGGTIRPVWFANHDATHNVTLIENPLDTTSQDFEHVVRPGEQGLILPHQNAWKFWPLPPELSGPDASKVVSVNATGDGIGYASVRDLPFTPAGGTGVFTGVTTLGGALDAIETALDA